MRPILLAVLVVLLFIFLWIVDWPAPPSFEGIQPLQWQDEADLSAGRIVRCTTWAFQSKTGIVWITAYHCIAHTFPTIRFFVGNREAVVIFENQPLDLAVLRGGPLVSGFSLATITPGLLDPIWTGGYPFGSDRLHVTAGAWSQTVDESQQSVYALPVAPGYSGAPVFNPRWQVVGIIQQEECWIPQGYCPVGRGIRLEQLRAVLIDVLRLPSGTLRLPSGMWHSFHLSVTSHPPFLSKIHRGIRTSFGLYPATSA